MAFFGGNGGARGGALGAEVQEGSEEHFEDALDEAGSSQDFVLKPQIQKEAPLKSGLEELPSNTQSEPGEGSSAAVG